MSWRLRIWCNDCSFGQDPQGCFDGGESESDEVFATKEEAEWWGGHHINGPWDCEVIECKETPNATFPVPDYAATGAEDTPE